MINPLNELSSVYSQNIAEGCGCDKKDEMVPQGKTPMGGDGARPGKNKKGYVEPMGEAKKDDTYLEPDMKKRQKNNEKARKDLMKGPQMKNPHFEETEVSEGHCEEKGVECSPVEKKKDSKKSMKEHVSWRQDLVEVMGDIEDSDDSKKEVKEKKIKNKIKINPPQGMTEGFAEIGGVVLEMYEITEKIDLKKADMGDVIKDFRKSDAPQFKGKSDKKKQQMAIAAKLDADEEGGMVGEETEEEKKKKQEQMKQQTKDHDDKMSGRVASEETIVELNRYEKETGTSSGSMNMPKGRPTQKGGDQSKAMRAVRQMMRSQTGKPEGQKKPADRRQQPTGLTPAQKVQRRREAAKKAQDTSHMSSRFD